MLSHGQKYFTIGALLAAMDPGQRIVLIDSANQTVRLTGRVLNVSQRTLRNVLSRSNTARGRGDPRDVCRVSSEKVTQSIWDAPQLVVRYAEPLIGMGNVFALSVTLEDKLKLEAADTLTVVECVRRSSVDTNEARTFNNRRLTNEFFKVTSDAARIREFGTAHAEQQQAIATDALRTLGITELMAATLKRMDEARLVEGADGRDLVQLPMRRTWLRAVDAVYGPGKSWTELEPTSGAVNEWYTKHVLSRGMRWCDFGFTQQAVRMGNGITNVLEAEYTQLRLACLRAGVTMATPDATAVRAKTKSASSDIGPVLELLTVAAGVDDAFVAPLMSQDKRLIECIGPMIDARRGAGLLRDNVYFAVPSERIGAGGPQSFVTLDGTPYYAALLTNVKLTVHEAVAIAALAAEDYHGRVASGQTPMPMVLKLAHDIGRSTSPVQRFDVPRTDTTDKGQPTDALWFDGSDMALTVPTAERVKDAFEGVGVWMTIDGEMLYREVFGLPGHADAISGDDFTAAVTADLKERGMEWWA